MGGARAASDSPDAGAVSKLLFKANLFSAEQQEELFISYFLKENIYIYVCVRGRITKNI